MLCQWVLVQDKPWPDLKTGQNGTEGAKEGTHCALEFWVELLDHVHPEAAGPLHAALLQEQDQPARALTTPVSKQPGASIFPLAVKAAQCSIKRFWGKAHAPGRVWLERMPQASPAPCFRHRLRGGLCNLFRLPVGRE